MVSLGRREGNLRYYHRNKERINKRKREMRKKKKNDTTNK